MTNAEDAYEQAGRERDPEGPGTPPSRSTTYASSVPAGSQTGRRP
ncbi:hypothetical protein SHJG_3396 [Streptomyces hygroscopicus subsp. jinggangensis 5008]|nr:hypothetical protein SHJG_3396 [Streptomyces hygroscopicus subsp. jinggangensis 5008]AGF62827.1 hypothetical protein SHJGH_3161 [Streptomyces hygroscopicus subsp. jinggangensis TL01]